MSRRELAGGFELDDDPARIDVDAVHAFLSHESYWGRNRPRELVQRAIHGSARVVGLYRGDVQVGFARVISDGATLAYLADVYILAAHRGHGLGTELLRETIDNGPHADLTWLLHTKDAQDLYAKLGFGPRTVHPVMERPWRDPTGEGPHPGI
jgi:ribosomal protein S18 acetylase RimI-like enzyme